MENITIVCDQQCEVDRHDTRLSRAVPAPVLAMSKDSLQSNVGGGVDLYSRRE